MKANIQHIIQLKKKNHLKYWITYYKIHTNIKGGAGWINFKDLKLASHITGLTPRTFSNHIKKLLKLGWISKGDHGYFFRSYHKLFGLNKVKIFGDTESELLARAARMSFELNIFRRINKIAGNDIAKKKKLLADKKHGRVGFGEYAVGVRWFAKTLELGSTRTAWKLEKTMEKMGMIRIKKNLRPICDIADREARKIIPLLGLSSRLTIKNNTIYERLLNGIKPL